MISSFQSRTTTQLLIFAFLGLLLPTHGFAQELEINVEVGLKTEKISAYKQRVNVKGLVYEDVTSIGGDVHVEGTIEGNINVLGGDVRLYRGAKVLGNVVCLGGEVLLPNNDNSLVEGKVINFFNPNEASSGKVLDTTQARVAFYFAHCLFFFMLVIALFYTFPNQVNEAGFQLSQDLVRAAIVGAMTLAAIAVGLVLSFLLMVVGVGFFLFLLVFCAFLMISVFGTVTIFYQMGVVVEAVSKSKVTVMQGTLLGIMIASLLLYVPLLGELMVLAFLLFGSGVVIDTRFGTNKQWFTRKARYWAA